MAQITLNSSGVASNGSLLLQSNGTTTAVTIDTSQNVGIGTASPSARLDVHSPADSVMFNVRENTSGNTRRIRFSNAGNVNTIETTAGTGATNLAFSVDGAERARIDSSGNLLVGTTSTDGRITAHASTSNASSAVLVGNTSAGNTLIRIRADGLYNLGLQTNSPYNFTSTGANAILFSDGTFGRATSSLKYKRNVEDTSHGLSDVLKLRAITYKSKNERDGDTIFGGLIAEEVDALGLNEFVQYAEDGTPDSIYYANMVSLAFKAIQEQQAIIQTLTDRITALEAK